MTVQIEDFNNGSDGQQITALETIFTNLSGTGVSAYTEGGYEGSLAARIVTTAELRALRTDIVPDGPWWAFYFQPLASPDFTAGIMQLALDTAIVATIRYNPDKSFTIRDGTISRYDTPVTTADAYWVSLRWSPASATGGRLKVYNAATGNLIDDSGDFATNATAVTNINNARIGVLSGTPTVDWTFDRIRFGTTAESLLPPTASVITVQVGYDQAAEPYTSMTLYADVVGGTAPYTYSWSQNAGTTVTLTGTGGTRTFTVPATLVEGTSLSFSVSVTDTNGATGAENVTVQVLSATEAYLGADGTWRPMRWITIPT